MMTSEDPMVPSPMKAALRRIGVYAGLLIFGAVFAFVYSYVPLHRAKNWQIDHLESRLEATNQELMRLRELVDSLEKDTSGRPDAETFQTVQTELDQADQRVSQLEQSLERAEKRVQELERSRDDWKSKHAELLARVEATSRARVATSRAIDADPQAPPTAGPATGAAEADGRNASPGSVEAAAPPMGPAAVSAPQDPSVGGARR